MAKIVDPDALTRDTEIVFDTTLKTIQLVATGNLSDTSPASGSGVTLQAVYSKCKLLWKSETDLNKLRFPFDAITAVKMDLVNGWDWADATTRRLIRDGGWCLRDSGGTSNEEYMSIISLGGSFISTLDTAYYQQISGFNQSITPFYYKDQLNEPVKVYGDATHGNINYREFYKIYLREQAKLYAQGNLLKDQGLALLDYTVYKLPLVNATDIKVTHSDGTIESTVPYTLMTVDYLRGKSFSTWTSLNPYSVDVVTRDTFATPIKWYRCTLELASSGTHPADDSGYWELYPGQRSIGTAYYAFNRIINGATANLEQIYEFAQHELRSTLNINDNPSGDNYGTIKGNIAVPLSNFLGDVLQTNRGCFIDTINPSDKVRIEFYDITVDTGGLDEEGIPLGTTKRTYPYIAAGKMVFNAVLVGDTLSEYAMYFKAVPSGTFDTTLALIVNDADGNPIQAESIPSSDINFTFDYDYNDQGGRTPATDATVDIVAIGLSGAQWVLGEFIITRAVGLNFPINAALERNYANP